MPAVANLLQEETWLREVASWDDTEADEKIREGVSIDRVLQLQHLLDLTDDEAAQIIGRSRSTYSRYRNAGKIMGVPEAERTVRFARLLGLASETFGSVEEACAWMHEPNYSLGDQSPLALTETDPGTTIVRNQLLGIQHGFSL